MNNPTEYRYTKEHEWVKIEGTTATMGITNHAQELLTDIVYVELPKLGKKVSQNQALGVVESVKSVSDVFSPISGTIIDINTALENAPELVNTAPFTDGWIAKLSISNPDELTGLLTAQDYEAFIA